jgi:hypothetical protein
MSAVNTLTCANCANPFPAPPFIRGKPQRFCGRACQTRAANMRRSIKRRGSAAQRPCDLSTAGKTPGRPSSPEAITIPPSASTPLSDSPNPTSDRIAELLARAHSKTGIDPFSVAELARLRGLSPWTPFRLIVSKDYQPRRKP